MRTLNRPMFRMGGPIKEGVMHGIREPKNMGGRMLLVGQHPKQFRDASGREKHAIPLGIWGANILRTAAWPFARQVIKQIPKFSRVKRIPGGNIYSKGYPGGKTKAGWKNLGPSKETIAQTSWQPTKLGSWFQKDPLYKTAATGTSWAGKGLRKAGSLAKGAVTTPSGLATTGGLTYMFWPDGTPKTQAEGAPTNVPLNPALQELQKKTKSDATASAAEFAKEQRNNRVEKYLKMMGYDSAKKTAIADALIDASKIVSDRGTLDRKNITAELINPAIQALSKRLDKPQQIREAVGLMATKAEIEKDLEDPSVKALRVAQLEKLNREASPSISETIMGYMASKKDDVKGKELVDLVRLAADKKNTPFTFMDEETIAKYPELEGKTALEIVSATAETDGVYMVGDAVIEVIGGTPRQIK